MFAAFGFGGYDRDDDRLVQRQEHSRYAREGGHVHVIALASGMR